MIDMIRVMFFEHVLKNMRSKYMSKDQLTLVICCNCIGAYTTLVTS